MKHLIIDQGHDPRFPGAKGEVEWVRRIGWTLQTALSAIPRPGFKLTVVPDGLGGTNGNGNLIRKINYINKVAMPGAFLVSLHGDGAMNPKARGLTVAYYGGSKYAEGKAKAMLECMKRATGLPPFGSGILPDTKARFGRLGMIRDTRPMALLVENGFVTNAADMSTDPAKFAQGIYNFLTQNYL